MSLVLAVLVALLREFWIKYSGRRDGRFIVSLGKTILLMLLFVGSYLLISIFCGFLAVFIYEIVKTKFELNLIKKLITLVVFIITLLVIPIFIACFWRFIKSGEKFLRSIKSGFNNLKGRYLKLMLLVTVFYCFGVFLNVLSQSVLHNEGALVIRFVLLTVCGSIAMHLSEKICK